MRARTIVREDGTVVRLQVDRRRVRCQCGKLAYSSKKLAKQAAKQQTRETGETIEAYHCWAGHCYHLGHPPKPYDRTIAYGLA